MTTEFGKAGKGDREIIESYLSALAPGAVVVNLGCGPNFHHELNNLARALGRAQVRSRLILADAVPPSIRNQVWVPGPETTEIVQLNVGTACETLGREAADLLIALGLFGALNSNTTPQGGGPAAVPAVLRGCFSVVKSDGHLIVGNSKQRQPIDTFEAEVRRAGFEVVDRHISVAIHGGEPPGEKRYLLVARKPGGSLRAKSLARADD